MLGWVNDTMGHDLFVSRWDKDLGNNVSTALMPIQSPVALVHMLNSVLQFVEASCLHKQWAANPCQYLAAVLHQ